MKNRPRPHVPEKVQIAVAVRQIGRLRVPSVFVERFESETQPDYLERLLLALAIILGCPRAELRLDHDPALRARVFDRRRYLNAIEAFKARRISSTERARRVASCYTPNANDPGALLYRPHSAEFEGSHHVKTNVRGDHGQFSDTVLIKRERRREKKVDAAQGRPSFFGKARAFQRQPAHAKIPARANPWPPAGSRPLRGRNR